MTKAKSSGSQRRRIRPALTPEARENQMISLAIDLAERQLIEGTASSQVIAHFLKLGSSRGYLEKEKLRKEAELLEAKKKSVESTQRSEELYENALKAMRNYTSSGLSSDD